MSKFNAQQFVDAIDLIAQEKKVSKEAVVNALKEAFLKAFQKTLDASDADMHVDISLDPAYINMYVFKDVIADEEDDENAYEIPLSKARLIDSNLNIGDKCRIDISVDELSKVAATVVKAVLKQQISEAEKVSLYEELKDRVGEMITGEVERCNENGCMVNIGRTSVYLSRKKMIGDEEYKPGDTIRLYVSDVITTPKGPSIDVSRSDPGFLRRLFEEESHDIYDGTVVIKELVREKGKRTKVAVYSNDPNVDAISACIGPNGSCIQKITAQLGNGHEREKIDIIPYSKNDAVFVMDALKPAEVIYIALEKEENKAIAIVLDGQRSLAIGRSGSNIRLASKLTGYDIQIAEEHEMKELEDEEGYEFLKAEDLRKDEEQRIQRENFEKYSEKIRAKIQSETTKESNSEGYEKVLPKAITDDIFLETEKTEVPHDKEETKEEIEEKVNESEPQTQKEVVVEEPLITKEVKTTTTIESLEKELEEEKKHETTFKATKKESRRPRQITEEEQPHDVKIEPNKNFMPIYTEEELQELEDEYNDDDLYDDDDEYDFDDFDSYYDDDK